MSGNSVGTVLGAAVGAAFGGNWQIGAMVGGWLGGVIDPTVIKGPSIGDAQEQTSRAGSPIPKCFGHTPPIGVTLIDGDKIARKIKRTQDVGKGSTQKTETEHFIATRAFLVCEGEISGFYRITRNGKLVYSTVPGDELEAESAAFASQLTIYTGTETQGPDPSLEAIHGVGNTHYYRGRSYFVVRDDEEIGGAMNRYMVEVAACGTVDPGNADYLEGLGPEFYYKLDGDGVDATGNHNTLAPGGGYSWASSGIDFSAKTGYAAGADEGNGLNSIAYTIIVAAQLDSDAGGSVTKNLFGHRNDHFAGNYRFSLHLRGPNNLTPEIGINHSAGGGTILTAPFEVAVGQRFTMGIRRNDTLVELLFNGEVVASGACSSGTGGLNGTAPFEVGGGVDYPNSYGFIGTVEAAVGYRLALSDAEALAASQYLVIPDDWTELPDAPGTYVDADGDKHTIGVATPSIGVCTPTWKEIVEEIAYRASPLLPAVLDIDHMTDAVPAFVLGNASLTGTDYVRTLCTYYFVDLSDYDGMLHAVRRGGPVVATFTEDDLLDVEEEDDDTRAPALEGYKRITVMYPDPANNYVPTPQTAPRTSPDITTSNTITLQCPIPFDAETMAQKADILQKIAFLQLEGGFKRAFPAEFSRYVPSDPIIFNDRRHIIVKASNDDSMVHFECQYDRPSAYSSRATPAVAPAPEPQASNLKGPTVLVAMNLPPLTSTETRSGIWVAAMGRLEGWPGCDVLLSVDGGITEPKVASITVPAEIGVLTGDLAAGAEPALVRLYTGSAELETVAPAQIAAGANRAAIITAGVAEIIQFETVDIDTSGDHELSDLVRGVLGTVDADHFTGDTFVTLTAAIFIPIDASHFGETLILRGVTKGTAVANNPTISIVYEGQETIIDGGEIT